MKLKSTFIVTARCKVFDNSDNTYNEDIELEFDLDKATRFLIRFYQNAFMIDGYKVIFRINVAGNVTNIMLKKEDQIYIVTNSNQLINEVFEGFILLSNIDKLSDISEFDFKAGIDIQELNEVEEDEFGDRD